MTILKNEIKRKVFHLISLIYVLGYIYLGRDLTLNILMIMFLLVSFIEFGRLHSSNLNSKIVGLFGGIHRKKEMNQPSGIFWTLIGSLLTMGLFPNREVVLCSMGYLIFGDAVSALIGVNYGRHKVFNKSIEGSISFFCVSMVIGLFFFNPLIAIVSSFFAALIELLPLPFSDNLWIPTLSACFLTLMIHSY